MTPMPGIRLTMICRDVHTPYSGMLPGFIAGHYSYDDAHIDLEPLARFAGARLYHDEVIGLDLGNRTLQCRSRPDVPYDLMSINIGSTPGFSDVPGADQFAVPVKPINNFLQRWDRLVTRVLAMPERARIGIVGAGAGGVELTLAAQFRLRRLLQEAGRSMAEPECHLFSSSATILPSHNRRVQRKFNRVLAERHVRVHEDCRVITVSEDGLLGADGHTYELDEILWVTDAIAPNWLREAGLAVDAKGFVRVNDALQSVSHPHVFAAGDIAAVENHPREKAGVIAVRQGKPLEQNLRRMLRGQKPRPFTPQKNGLALISTGDPYAVASRGRFYLAGRAVWTWKDWIDRRFMRRYNQLPSIPIAAS
jgi:selenide,water dikinase